MVISVAALSNGIHENEDRNQREENRHFADAFDAG